jgi:hypothetical protein
MNFLRKLWRRMRCKHVFVFLRNYHGDLITHSGGKRSLWVCRHCDKYQERDIIGP